MNSGILKDDSCSEYCRIDQRARLIYIALLLTILDGLVSNCII